MIVHISGLATRGFGMVNIIVSLSRSPRSLRATNFRAGRRTFKSSSPGRDQVFGSPKLVSNGTGAQVFNRAMKGRLNTVNIFRPNAGKSFVVLCIFFPNNKYQKKLKKWPNIILIRIKNQTTPIESFYGKVYTHVSFFPVLTKYGQYWEVWLFHFKVSCSR